MEKYLAESDRKWEKANERLEREREEHNTEVQKLIKTSREETGRYLGALEENFQHGLSAVAEQFLSVKETLDEHGRKLDSHTEMIGELKVDVTMIREELDEHGRTLHEHSKVLKEHSKVLKEHSKILNDQSATLGSHSKDLAEIKDSLREKADRKSLIELDKRVFFLETQQR